jgi:hypothetical protein
MNYKGNYKTFFFHSDSKFSLKELKVATVNFSPNKFKSHQVEYHNFLFEFLLNNPCSKPWDKFDKGDMIIVLHERHIAKECNVVWVFLLGLLEIRWRAYIKMNFIGVGCQMEDMWLLSA